MSMPQKLFVAVISDRHPSGGEIAATVTSLLSDFEDPIQPYLAACAIHQDCRPALSRAIASRGLILARPVNPWFLNPKMGHLWLALDHEGENTARGVIKEFGRSPRSFYRNFFPDPVVGFGSAIPEPESDKGLEDWIDQLASLVEPWKRRLWEAFCESSGWERSPQLRCHTAHRPLPRRMWAMRHERTVHAMRGMTPAGLAASPGRKPTRARKCRGTAFRRPASPALPQVPGRLRTPYPRARMDSTSQGGAGAFDTPFTTLLG